MTGKIYWNTVTPLLKDVLLQLMSADEFDTFRLVGGTSLSLQLGHRMSVDIDLFTDALYGSVNFGLLAAYLQNAFPYFSGFGIGPTAMGVSCAVGINRQDSVKLDIYYIDPFIRKALAPDGIRMATIEEIAAMKMDVMQRKGRMKDFWDIHEILDIMPISKMIALHEERYPYDHDAALITTNLTNFSEADNDFQPICLRGKHWEIIKTDIIKAVS
ncbi:hypothetical protein CJD36_017340 [Flavipsychrobacter stenotrophus]|uniref:Nucleotidyl transferase AbiEii/AbiGii toxin family protein n=1 Tax=Flavipsychrobacter stenotrophus TaxID=2077091 RepID=A0A2S7SSW5_9BACT|nr:nucleotidyl transferase AbiEii/AbiGii toxin family protein [Flavipsychrobacter stenotrophus]PQJ09695.1 hypothetical protein CJD36_017340 [Flavipsychrobacter stenotrophus]